MTRLDVEAVSLIVLQCVAVFFSLQLQCAAVCCSCARTTQLTWCVSSNCSVAALYIVLQLYTDPVDVAGVFTCSVAARCSVLQCVTAVYERLC